MRNIILMMLFAGVAFSASAAGSWFLQSKLKEKDAAEPEDVVALETSAEDPQAPDQPGNGETAIAASGADLPVAVRPRPMSVEEVLRFGMGLRKRETQLNEREKSLNQEEERIKLALADIRGEQQHIESLHAKLQGQTEQCQTILSEIEQARQQLAAERENARQQLEEFQEVRVDADEQEMQNIKKMSEWFQSMEPESAAGALKELVNDGKTDLAVKLLFNFEARDASKILSALDDYPLMIELAERVKEYKRPPRKEARRR